MLAQDVGPDSGTFFQTGDHDILIPQDQFRIICLGDIQFIHPEIITVQNLQRLTEMSFGSCLDGLDYYQKKRNCRWAKVKKSKSRRMSHKPSIQACVAQRQDGSASLLDRSLELKCVSEI